jgi:hypothetical protein
VPCPEDGEPSAPDGYNRPVQTFLPHPDFAASARALDDRRLGKQRVEALQVLRALHRPGYGWRHHPAVHMWRGYERALAWYGLTVCEEWISRGRADTCWGKILEEIRLLTGDPHLAPPALHTAPRPPWLGDERLHASHRASLLRKDPEHYGSRFDDPGDLPYFWPSAAGGRR